MDVAPQEGKGVPKLPILRTLPSRSHLSGPEFSTTAGNEFLALALIRVRGAEGQRDAAQLGSGRLTGCRAVTVADPVRRLICPHRRQQVLLRVCSVSRILSTLFCFSRLFPFSHLFSSSPASQALRTDPLQDRLSVLSKDETYLSPASSWGCAKTGFTFISLARASDCWGGQGQLGAGPQLGAVPWSGLVSSSSYQA